MKLTDSFDGIDPSGKPVLSAERRTISDPEERRRIEQFLDGGGPVMWTSKRSLDLMDPDRGRVVPTIFKTDGEWVWTASIRYYLIEHEVPLESAFLEHIRDRNYISAEPSAAQMRQAIDFLNEEIRRLNEESRGS